MRAWHNAESVGGNLTLLCEFFVFQKNTWFFIRRVKCFLHTFAKPCRWYCMEEKIPQIEYADRTATQKEGIRKLRVGIITLHIRNMKKKPLIILSVSLALSGLGVWLSYVEEQKMDNRIAEGSELLNSNIEALSLDEGNPGLFDDRTAWLSVLSSGDCGYKYDIYTVSWDANGGKTHMAVDVYTNPASGKLLTVDGNVSFTYPNGSYSKDFKETKVVVTGNWRVCEMGLHTCDRALQVLCDGTTSSYTTLNRPSNSLN